MASLQRHAQRIDLVVAAVHGIIKLLNVVLRALPMQHHLPFYALWCSLH